MPSERPTFGSLFAGIGGIDLGLWSGVERVDLLAGGFPCQPVSFAGSRGIQADDRWLWPEFQRAIRSLRPRYVLVENVPGLLVGGGMDDVLGGLAELGYDAEWDLIPAAAVGAPHLRYRVWIIAYRQADAPRPDSNGSGPHRAGVDELGDAELRDEQVGEPRSVGAVLADADGGRLEGQWERGVLDGFGPSLGCHPDGRNRQAMAYTNGSGLPLSRQEPDGTNGRKAGGGSAASRWWSTEPDVGRVAHGVPARVDRLRALGNAVVPQVVEYIGRRILEAEGLT